METRLYLECFIAGLLGVLLYLWVKITAEKKRALAANVPFSMVGYLKADIMAIIGSVLAVVTSLYVLDELVGFNQSILKVVKLFFITVGYTGASLVISAIGTFSKRVRMIVDEKTNELSKMKGE